MFTYTRKNTHTHINLVIIFKFKKGVKLRKTLALAQVLYDPQ